MKLHIKNFRSIESLNLELAPVTVLYGHNGTGKSSALYAPLTLKNIVIDPNRRLQEFFNYGFASLGAFGEIVFDHDRSREVELGVSIETHAAQPLMGNAVVEYKVVCANDDSGIFQINIVADDMEDGCALQATFPYSRYNSANLENIGAGELWWNGVGIAIDEAKASEDCNALDAAARETITNAIDLPASELKKVDFVPLRRGFLQPSYSLGAVSPMAATENEMTSLIANERYLEYAISDHMERILNRDFRIRNRIGSKTFTLDCIDKQSRVGASLVNDGFGVNQLVYLLAKVLRPDAGLVCIEEPEIHLHPTAIRRLAHELTSIVGQSDSSNRLLISTHSEQFIMSLLALVAKGEYPPDGLALYLVQKDGKVSKFHRQQVNENGQVEGGLATFIEGELEDMKAFLGV